MSDQRLRELERRFRATGDAQDEAAWLAERMRLEPGLDARLAAAACAGHRAACAALGAAAAPTSRLLDWTEALARHGRAPLVAAATGSLRPIISGDERGGIGDRDTRQALAAASAWLADPSPANEALCAEMATSARTMAGGLPGSVGRPTGQNRRSLEARCLSIRLSIEAEGASCAAALAVDRRRTVPGRIAAHAITCAALVARGTPRVLARAHDLLSALHESERGGPALFDERLDAAILDRARRGVVEWAIVSPPPQTPVVRALADRLLGGHLPPSLVLLAAQAGDPVARAALGVDAPPVDLDLRRLVEALTRFGRDGQLRAALAAATALAEVGAAPVVAAATAYVGCPCPSCAGAVERVVEGLTAPSRTGDLLAGCVAARDEAATARYAQASVRWCVLRQACLARGLGLEAARALEAACVPGAKRAADPATLEALRVVCTEALFTADGPVVAAVRAAVVAWALAPR